MHYNKKNWKENIKWCTKSELLHESQAYKNDITQLLGSYQLCHFNLENYHHRLSVSQLFWMPNYIEIPK